MGRFEKAFKDPEFLKLFTEYAQEVSDPKNREETEAYLRQLEAEGRAEEVYGKGVQLIMPVPAYVLKTRNKETGEKVFINVCTCDKVRVVASPLPPRQRAIGPAGGQLFGEIQSPRRRRV